MLFIPSNDTQLGVFNEYVKYFLEKQRAGVVTLKKHMLYLLPPCEATNQVYAISDNEILGVFADNTDPAAGKYPFSMNIFMYMKLGKGSQLGAGQPNLKKQSNNGSNPIYHDIGKIINLSDQVTN